MMIKADMPWLPQDHLSIAIIGMAGRFPGAADVEKFWHNVATGVKSIRRFSDEELLLHNVDAALLKNKHYVKVGAPLQDVEMFDAAFFGYTPQEAILMDPQHRVFLECAWQACEHAGYDPEACPGLVGVFAGTSFSSYLLNNLLSHADIRETMSRVQIATGNDKDSLSSMVSYKLNFRGPSLVIQTFSSTSLAAVHIACQSLLNDECDLALAGGVSLTIPQEHGYLYTEGGSASSDGECRSFDRRAQGYVSGNGVGVVVLKRLDHALHDGDTIHAVIKGSAINNDGRARPGYTTPGVDGQAQVIVEALAAANVPAETIEYIEANGTATPLGDEIELMAMIKAFRLHTQKQGFCALGSAKPAIGHLECASGVTALIKVAQALSHRILPPLLNFENTSPGIDLAHSPFFVNTAAVTWPAATHPRRAGVSSFGLGGTNVHVIVEEAPDIERVVSSRSWYILPFSARTKQALYSMQERMLQYLQQHTEIDIADVAYTLQVGRTVFNYRQVFICSNTEDAITHLQGVTTHRLQPIYQARCKRPVMFYFSGTEPISLMASCDLYREYPLFRTIMDTCQKILRNELHIDVLTWDFPTQCSTRQQLTLFETKDGDAVRAQVSSFVFEYALARQLIQWGIIPQALLGYGVGEYVAACLSNVLSLNDVLFLLTQPVSHKCSFRSPEIPYISSVTHDWITQQQATDPQYWAQIMKQEANEPEGINLLKQKHDPVVLHVGVHLTREQNVVARSAAESLLTLFSLSSNADAIAPISSLLEVIGKLWLAGVQIDWTSFHKPEKRHRIPLPTYPFERQRYWIDMAIANQRTPAARISTLFTMS